MAPSKLSESDKKKILELYRQPGVTTAIIASQFDVSTATVSRILKQGIPEDEYEILIQQKRGGSLKGPDEVDDEPEAAPVEPEPTAVPTPKRRRRPSAAQSAIDDDTATQLSIPPIEPESTPVEVAATNAEAPEVMAQEIYQEELTHPSEFGADDEADDLDEDEDLDDDLDDDFDDEDEDDDLALDGEPLIGAATVQVRGETMIKVLPLEEATIPKTFYLVVDRASELITRPLKDFAELGRIPEEEVQEKTLPIFDNHRVAKRFLRKMQRVIKVPDGRVLPKVSPYLQARGITRLLIDGQIYSL